MIQNPHIKVVTNNSNDDDQNKKPDPPGSTRHLSDNDYPQIPANISMNEDNNSIYNRSVLSGGGRSITSNSIGRGGVARAAFSSIRGSMDDTSNFQFTPRVNSDSNEVEIVNAVDAVVIQNVHSNEISDPDSNYNNNNNQQSLQRIDDNHNHYNEGEDDDEEEEIAFDEYEMDDEARMVQFTKGGGGPTQHMHVHNNNNNNSTTTSTPVNMFDLSSIEPSQPMYSSAISNMHNNNDYNHRDSQLLVRHLTRAALLSEEYDDNVVEISPALKRRLRDFKFAQRKRREKYGELNPWGIIGLYDHLTGIRTDIEWAEDAAWRRENDQPYLSWQDFEDAKDTGFNQPFFTYFAMLVCTTCLVVSIGLNGWKVEKMTVNPMIGPSAEVLVRMGAKKTNLIVNNGEWFRVFTSMFLHAGIIHYVINMLALWFIGSAVEQSHGFFAAALLFTLPAVGGTLLSALFLPEYISVGASGGIFGLIGACLADIFSNWGLLFSKHVNENNSGQRFRHVKVLIWLVLDIILNIVIGLTPFVDNFTHMGGMIFGFFCGLSTMERLSKAFFGVKTNWISTVQTFSVRFLGIIVSVLCIIAGFIVLASMDTESMVTCRACRYVSCVPFPFWETENKWWYCDDCNKQMVKGKLYQDPSTLYYTHLDLTCPDNSIVKNITLTEKTNDEKFFRQNLPTYCRAECDELFAN